jgi:hypothetical protein
MSCLHVLHSSYSFILSLILIIPSSFSFLLSVSLSLSLSLSFPHHPLLLSLPSLSLPQDLLDAQARGELSREALAAIAGFKVGHCNRLEKSLAALATNKV